MIHLSRMNIISSFAIFVTNLEQTLIVYCTFLSGLASLGNCKYQYMYCLRFNTEVNEQYYALSLKLTKTATFNEMKIDRFVRSMWLCFLNRHVKSALLVSIPQTMVSFFTSPYLITSSLHCLFNISKHYNNRFK